MTSSGVHYQHQVLRCAKNLSSAATACERTARVQSFVLAAESTLTLSKCPPAAWGDTPVVIARLLLPTEVPKTSPGPLLEAASFWAFHLFALLNTAPTIQRSFVDATPFMYGGKILSRLRKRVDELLVVLTSATQDYPLSPHAGIVMQVINLYGRILQEAGHRENIDLPLFEFIAADIERRIKRFPAKEYKRIFDDMAERADAVKWEANRIIEAHHRHRLA